MSLKIFGNNAPKANTGNKFANDVVARFRSGHVVGKRPVALSEWRVTTGDPDVAETIHGLFGGDAPAKWDAHGEDDIEVFTETSTVDVILEPGDGKAIRSRLIWWGRNGKVIRETDGETCSDGTPDPDAGKSLAERKQLAKDGLGPEPQVEVYFRLADDPDLGIVKFQSGSWSLVSDLAYHGTEDVLAEATGPVRATLSLEEVSFVAKNGDMAGKTVTYTKPVIKIED